MMVQFEEICEVHRRAEDAGAATAERCAEAPLDWPFVGDSPLGVMSHQSIHLPCYFHTFIEEYMRCGILWKKLCTGLRTGAAGRSESGRSNQAARVAAFGGKEAVLSCILSDRICF